MTITERKTGIAKLEREREDVLRDIWLLLKQADMIIEEISSAKIELYKQQTEKHQENYFVYSLAPRSKVPIV